MAQRQPRQGVLRQPLNIVLRGNLDELRHFADEIVDTHLRAHGQEELRVAKILIFRNSSRPYKTVARREGYRHELGWNYGLHQIPNLVIENREAPAEIVVIIIRKILRTSL